MNNLSDDYTSTEEYKDQIKFRWEDEWKLDENRIVLKFNDINQNENENKQQSNVKNDNL